MGAASPRFPDAGNIPSSAAISPRVPCTERSRRRPVVSTKHLRSSRGAEQMTFKSGMTVTVTDTTSAYFGSHGPVISTATREDFQLVGVQFPHANTIWFLSSQLKQSK